MTISTATVPLAVRLSKAERRQKIAAFGLVSPLLAFLLFVFVLPIGSTLFFAVQSLEVRKTFPETVAALADWNGSALPDEKVFETLARELVASEAAKTVAGAGTRLNYEISGYRSMIMRTARNAERLTAPYRESVVALEPRWGDIGYWQAFASASGPLTVRYLLQAVDHEQKWDGSIAKVAPDRAIYVNYLGRTFWISASVTIICILIGYPIAYYAVSAGPAVRALVLACVLLPFWISVLVRTAAWVIVLQKEGLVNGTLLRLGLIDQPMQLIFNRFGVYVAMVHVLLPFLVMPLYSVMKNIPTDHVRAAESLGASPFVAFASVFLPQSLPGLSAGALLVFISALGYYITPALIGGAGDQMLSYLITQFALEVGNWGMAGAVSMLLLVSTAAAYAVFRKLFGARGFMA
jgi:putative spermidine/putrescine transport system permease protein